jgi:biotin operon repressor
MARGKIFSNHNRLEKMLRLRTAGYSYIYLAKLFNVDHTTVIYHCRKAGISITGKKRKEMYLLMDKGVSKNQISSELGIGKEVVERYIELYKEGGKKMYSRKYINFFKKIKPKEKKQIKIKKEKLIPKLIPKSEEVPIILTKTDKRGVLWRDNGKGKWICVGMSKEAKIIEEETKRRKALELKRLQLLAY